MYENNYWNADFGDLTFDIDERLITRWQIYSVKYDIIFRLNNGSIVNL